MAKSSKFRDRVGADNEREKARGSSYGHLILPRGIKMFQVQGGDRVRLDFLPYVVTDEHHPNRNDDKDVAVPGTEWYRRPYRLHRNIGSENDSVVCLTSIGKKCPVCDYRTRLQREGKSEDEELKALKASDRNLYVVVPIGHKEYDEVPHIFDISRYCFQDALREETDENPEYRPFFDPSVDGFTLNIRFSEEKLGKNKYAAASRIDFETRKQGYDDDFLKKVPNLDECLQILSYKELESKFFELGDEGEAPEIVSDSVEGENVSPGRVPPRRRREESHERPSRTEREESREREEPKSEDPPRRQRREPEPEPAPARSRREREPEPEQAAVDPDTPENACIACEGSGEDSRGRTCPTCRGTGVRPSRMQRTREPEPEPEQEKPAAAPMRRKPPAAAAPEKTAKSGECPFGHVFGKDNDRFKDCADCKVWDPCFDASDEVR